MDIRELRTPAALESAHVVLRELRPELSLQDFLSIYEDAKSADGFTLVGAFHEEKCVAVLGYRVLSDFIHRKHVYVDDLIVTESYRSKRVGAELLRYAERIAKDHGCEMLRLCAGVQNEKAHKFYEREGWQPKSIAFKKRV